MQCSGEEYLGTYSSGSWKISPGGSGLARLDQYASLFQEYRIDKWVVKIKPTVGTTSAGTYVAGVSYDYARQPTDFRGIAVLAPKVTGTVWQAATLTASAQRLMRQSWMLTSGTGVSTEETVSGYVCLATDGTDGRTTMSVWVDYSVTLQGPSSVSRAQADDIYTYDSANRRWEHAGHTVTTFSPVDGPVVVDAEVEGSGSSLVAALEKAMDGLAKLHEVTSGGLTYLHLVANNVHAGALAVLSAAAIVRVARAPFRPIGFSWLSPAGVGSTTPRGPSSRVD